MARTTLRIASEGAGRPPPRGPGDAEPTCLGAPELAALDRLAAACDHAYSASDNDIEFAFRDGAVHLLQRRPVTGG